MTILKAMRQNSVTLESSIIILDVSFTLIYDFSSRGVAYDDHHMNLSIV